MKKQMNAKISCLMNVEIRWWKFNTSSSRSLCLLLMVIIAILFAQPATAQLKRYPVQRKNAIQKQPIQRNSNARIQDVPLLSLPFWDDFSFTPVNNPADTFANYPLRSLWAKGENVWINNGMGINAPSRNVASFDGLDSLGLPFSDQILLNGFRDTLMSHPIKMTAVSIAGQDSVFLSFFYQWQGNGEPPDANDYMLVEFKDNTGKWNEVATIKTDPSFDRTVFYDTLIKVNGAQYFHDDFQFRFRNFGRKSGPFDTWNIDYVYLDKDRTINSNSYPDRAIASTISPLFGDYYAIPIQHFFEAQPLEQVNFDIQNLKGPSVIGVSVSYKATVKYKNYHGGIASLASGSTVQTPVNGGVMFPYERANVELPAVPEISKFDPTADSIEVFIKAKVVSGDSIDALRFAFAPLDFRINDTLTVKYTLDDYYAYDDGTAEYSAGLTNWGIIMAYAFDMATDETDTLAGFDAYFPDFALGSNRLISYYVYGDDNGLPDSENPLITIRNRSAERKGLNTFQRISFSPVKVTKRFYIAYESADVQVGLDISHDTGDKIFTNIAGPWTQNTDLVGSLMIRPVFIEGVGGPVTGLPAEEKSIFSLYPNPNHGEFYIHGRVKVTHILSVTGQSLPFLAEEDGERQKISIPNASAGLYLLKIQQGTSVVTKKIVVR